MAVSDAREEERALASGPPLGLNFESCSLKGIMTNPREVPICYTNWRGETGLRRIVPKALVSGAKLPGAATRCIDLIAELALISKCSAASRREAPPSTRPRMIMCDSASRRQVP